MNILREVAGELLKMFVADAWLAGGILAVVSLTGGLTRYAALPPLVDGAILLLGCIGVLLASVALTARVRRVR
jgi:hypothetical protein